MPGSLLYQLKFRRQLATLPPAAGSLSIFHLSSSRVSCCSKRSVAVAPARHYTILQREEGSLKSSKLPPYHRRPGNPFLSLSLSLCISVSVSLSVSLSLALARLRRPQSLFPARAYRVLTVHPSTRIGFDVREREMRKTKSPVLMWANNGRTHLRVAVSDRQFDNLII